VVHGVVRCAVCGGCEESKWTSGVLESGPAKVVDHFLPARLGVLGGGAAWGVFIVVCRRCVDSVCVGVYGSVYGVVWCCVNRSVRTLRTLFAYLRLCAYVRVCVCAYACERV
jgi:hypothetical protein